MILYDIVRWDLFILFLHVLALQVLIDIHVMFWFKLSKLSIVPNTLKDKVTKL